jgi:hypothetical protein
MKKVTIVQGCVTVLAVLLAAASSFGGPSTYKTKLTFSQPVRVPGVTLPAGTYYFQAPQATNRTLVKITDENGKLMTQFMGIPEHTRKRDHDVITIGSNECKPTALKSWFYPGNRTGVRFVYPQDQAAMIAASCNEPIPEVHESIANVSQLQTEKVYLAMPKGQEEEYKPEALSASDELDKSGFDGESISASR